MSANIKLTIYGTRGSTPIFGDKYRIYGGSTSCYLVEKTIENYSGTEADDADGSALILDAGSGIENITGIRSKKVAIILTHSHVDHMIGLPVFPLLNDPEKEITIYLTSRNGLSARQQIEQLVSPPLWPCKLEDYSAKVTIEELGKELELSGALIKTMESNHPGGSSILSLEHIGRKIVYATDFEHEREDGSCALEELAEFSRGADMILYDAQYSEEEYPRFKGFGHSTPQAALKLKELSGAGKMLLIHHSTAHDDDYLTEADKKLAAKDVHFGKEGEIIYL